LVVELIAMRFRLRTLMILMAILPPLLAVSWHLYQRHQQHLARQRLSIFKPMPSGIIDIYLGGSSKWLPDDMDDGAMTMRPVNQASTDNRP